MLLRTIFTAYQFLFLENKRSLLSPSLLGTALRRWKGPMRPVN